MQKLTTVQELELLLLEHGEEVIDMLGQQVDRIEKNIKVKQLVSSVSVPGYLTPVLVLKKIKVEGFLPVSKAVKVLSEIE